MTKDQIRQLQRKTEYFKEYLNENIQNGKKVRIETDKLHEMLMYAYLRGRGDKV